MLHPLRNLAGASRTKSLLVAPLACVALLAATGTAEADDYPAANHLGQVQSGGKAHTTPAANPPDWAAPPAGAGGGRKLR